MDFFNFTLVNIILILKVTLLKIFKTVENIFKIVIENELNVKNKEVLTISKNILYLTDNRNIFSCINFEIILTLSDTQLL